MSFSRRSSLADGSDPLPAIRAGLYTPAEGTEGRIKQLEVEVYALGGLSEFRQPSVLASLISAVIERYFPLTPAEMEEMESDPETYHHDNDASSYEDQLRPCSETFFLTLLEQDRPGLAPHVASILQTALESCPPGTAHRAGTFVIFHSPFLLAATNTHCPSVKVSFFYVYVYWRVLLKTVQASVPHDLSVPPRQICPASVASPPPSS